MDELTTEQIAAAAARDLAGRSGYDPEFLGVPVAVPTLHGVKTVLLPYTHFSVLMRPDKRLAAVTALAMDGTRLIDLNRAGIQWRRDPRIPADRQTGERVYAHNEIDRGHLVRRASAVWGDTRAEAAQANEDSFHYTNAAPQAAKFNQGAELWLGLESYLQENAADNSRKITVFTGPIFGANDPVYRGVDIPLQFFKVAVFLYRGELAATGYVVDQTPVLADLPDAASSTSQLVFAGLSHGRAKLTIAAISPDHGQNVFQVIPCLLRVSLQVRLGKLSLSSQRQGGRMSTGDPAASDEGQAFAPPGKKAPVPAPPTALLARPRVVEQSARSKSREHEVQRLIRDLAALAATHHVQAAWGIHVRAGG